MQKFYVSLNTSTNRNEEITRNSDPLRVFTDAFLFYRVLTFLSRKLSALFLIDFPEKYHKHAEHFKLKLFLYVTFD